ncbi:MAG: shikimate kinase [Atopobiaceae bacterium]
MRLVNQPDDNQEVTFGLVGKTLAHSWSPQIHTTLGSAPYTLIELEPEEVATFIRHGSWKGLNVTIPYKQKAYELADYTTASADALGVANTLVHTPDGAILADNTDYAGFAWMLERFCTQELGVSSAQALLQDKKVLVLGSGGASKAVCAALQDAGAHVVVISRSGKNTYANLVSLHHDAALMVNTTPVGTYPNCPASVVSDEMLMQLTQLKGVLDVVYNPQRTGLMLAAEKLGLPTESGLGMLVAQAAYSSARFLGKAPVPTADASKSQALLAPDPIDIQRIERLIKTQSMNIALIGMPGSGKTTTGRRLARLLRRPFVDMDDAFGLDHGITPAECIRRFGEAHFRDLEHATLKACAARSCLVIACGGGVVVRPENFDILRQNSMIVMLDRDLSQLSVAGRPLSQAEGVKQLARDRMALYRSWANIILPCTGSAAGDAEAIMALLDLPAPAAP